MIMKIVVDQLFCWVLIMDWCRYHKVEGVSMILISRMYKYDKDVMMGQQLRQIGIEGRIGVKRSGYERI